MAREQARKTVNTFVRGLITEASALSFPEEAAKDILNVQLNRDGSLQRRKGMDFENNYVLGGATPTTTVSDAAVTSHEWRAAGANGRFNFAVVQVGETLHFYDLDSETLSAGKKSFTVDMGGNDSDGISIPTGFAENPGSAPIHAVSGFGYLFVVSKDTEPFYIKYDSESDSITTHTITLKVRDLSGVEDDLDPDEHPASLSAEHEYNLRNQGWSVDALLDTGSAGDTIAYYETRVSGEYPSNSMVWWEAKNSDIEYDPPFHKTVQTGNTLVARGRFILEAFNKKRLNGVDGVAESEQLISTGTIDDEIELNRPSAVAFYSARVWYTGVDSQVVSNTVTRANSGIPNNTNVYFSPVLLDVSKAGRCYQEADPTSEDSNALIASDGGVIQIPEAGLIRNLLPVGSTLLVFASNGVWAISGDLESGFTADNFQVYKVSSVGSIGRDSVVQVESGILYWADGGIYSVSPDAQVGRFVPQNLTDTTIQDFYSDIPRINKKNAVGNYDPIAKKVSWLYPIGSDYTESSYRNRYDGELWLDVTLGAFYPYQITDLATDSPFLSGKVNTTSEVNLINQISVVDSSAEEVVDSSGNVVYIEKAIKTSNSIGSKYLTLQPISATNHAITFSLYRNTSFLDWESADNTGIDYSSYILTGTELFGDPAVKKQTPYIICYFNKTEDGYTGTDADLFDFDLPSGCLLQSRWDFTNLGTSGKWSKPQQVYRLKRYYQASDINDSHDYGYEVVVTKTRMRGAGKALNLYFNSQTEKDFHLLGWSYDVAAG